MPSWLVSLKNVPAIDPPPAGWASNAPISTRAPRTRGKPRWSAKRWAALARVFEPASIAGLPESSAIVLVGPPLLARAPSFSAVRDTPTLFPFTPLPRPDPPLPTMLLELEELVEKPVSLNTSSAVDAPRRLPTTIVLKMDKDGVTSRRERREAAEESVPPL